MGFIAGIWLFVLGALGAANLIIAKKPEAEEIFAKVTPYQGWIGVVSMIWGVWVILHSILNLGWLKVIPFWWLTYLATGVLLASLGLLLGVGVLKTFVKQPQAMEKMDALVARLAPFQGNLGLGALGLGVWSVIAAIVWSV